MGEKQRPIIDIDFLKKNLKRPKKAVVTGGMPYANGPVHLGHLAGAHIPPDIYARYLRMLIGDDNVLFICGTDDHGSATELASIKENKNIEDFLREARQKHEATFDQFNISFDNYTSTSASETISTHSKTVQNFIRALDKNSMLQKIVSKQWYDLKYQRFLQDRFVTGECPKCSDPKAYSDSCDACGAQYDPSELLNAKSALSGEKPELRDTTHWHLDLWKVGDDLSQWILSKKKDWRTIVFKNALNTVLPELEIENKDEEKYKSLKSSLPQHKSRYAPGKKIVLQFQQQCDLHATQELFLQNEIDSVIDKSWALRSISRDVKWGIPMPTDLDSEMSGKTFYVWPESLIAPISFSKVALEKQGQSSDEYKKFWRDPEAKIYQFIGQDNIYFYTLMQGALWLGAQNSNDDSSVDNQKWQMTEVIANYHLMVDGEKMSKSKGNFYTGDELLKKGYHVDQIRHFVSLLSLSEKNSNFDFDTFQERNKFLAGPLNAAIEKPISACHSKFNGVVPSGTLMEKVDKETFKIVQRYFKAMQRVEYSQLLFALDNYARIINSLFSQFKPHDDRLPEADRANSLYNCFYVLKNLSIMLYPFVPSTMEKVRQSLNLGKEIWSIDELGKEMPAGHKISAQQEYFPTALESAD